jgi:uncharacterized protein (DUF1330 family)
VTSDALTLEEQKVLAYIKSGSAFQLLQLLAEVDAEVQNIIKNKSFTLGLHIAGGMKRSVRIEDGHIKPIDNSTSGSGVIFRFPDAQQLNKLLSGKKSKMIPVIRSLSAGRIISDFKAVTGRIPLYMSPEADFLSENFRIITRLLMNAALRGIKEVAENDSYTKARVAAIPDGIISVRVENESDLEIRLEKKGGSFNLIQGNNGRTANAVLTFNNVNTAYQLFTGKINAVAALGTSDVKIRGRIPMIQGLFPILDRLSYYMAIK